jgi:predicted phosphohydrolase
MKIHAISDLHLSGENVTKPMSVFNSYKSGYIDEVKKNWDSTVDENDIVLISGDISWAMYLKDAQYDLNFIGLLKGIKILVRGNHDYWWKSISSVRKALCGNTYAVQNDSIRFKNIVICGTRGWTVPEPSEEISAEDIKLRKREAERLQISLKDAADKRQEDDILICMMHYPPINSDLADNEFTLLLNEYKVDKVVFGHLHGSHIITPLYQIRKNIEYYLTSCDKVENNLVRIL